MRQQRYYEAQNYFIAEIGHQGSTNKTIRTAAERRYLIATG